MTSDERPPLFAGTTSRCYGTQNDMKGTNLSFKEELSAIFPLQRVMCDGFYRCILEACGSCTKVKERGLDKLPGVKRTSLAFLIKAMEIHLPLSSSSMSIIGISSEFILTLFCGFSVLCTGHPRSDDGAWLRRESERDSERRRVHCTVRK